MGRVKPLALIITLSASVTDPGPRIQTGSTGGRFIKLSVDESMMLNIYSSLQYQQICILLVYKQSNGYIDISV